MVFDLIHGKFDVHRSDASLFLSSATIGATLANGKRSIATPAYEHLAESKRIADALGKGQQLVVHSRDANRELDFESRYTLYERHNCLVAEAACRNVSRHDLIIRGIEPICALAQNDSALRWPGATRALTNGPMYYDAGTLHDFNSAVRVPAPYGAIKGGALFPDFSDPASGRVHSWWNVGLFRGYNQEGLVCGFIDNHSGLGQIVLSKMNSDEFSLHTESAFAPATTLQPGQGIHSNRLTILVGANPYDALETYAQIMGALNRARCRSIVTGWCSWFYTYEFVSEDEVIRNAQYAARHLKPYGLEYIQIDEGYQRCHGDWEANERFPHGMKWLAERIKSLGLKPGIWIAPYVVSELAPVYREHPEWLLKRPNGHPLRVGPWPNEDTVWAQQEAPKRYGLDVTHPGAQAWLFGLFDKLANDWGYEMFKIDFVAWSLLSAHRYHDPAATPAQAYRTGMEIIRSAIGPARHINDCGPGPVSVGLIDSMRIECDQNYGYGRSAWKHYFTASSSCAPAAAKRYYFHRRTWINDADHLCTQLLAIPQAQAAASLIAISGGNAISGDRLPDLDATRLEIIKKAFPAFGQAARPVDLFDSDRPSVFTLTIKKPYGQWTIVSLFNYSDSQSIEKSYPLERLGLNPEATYVAYDFWMERFWGEVTDALKVTLMPAGATVLALHEKSGVPQFISTDRHVLQGAIELEDLTWNAASHSLSGISIGPINSSHQLSIYLPAAHPWTQAKRSLPHDVDGYTLKLVDDHILRVHLRFNRSERVTWCIRFDALFES